MDAEDLLLRQFLGIRDEATTAGRRAASSAASSATTAPGPPSTAGPANSPPPSRRTSRCGWRATPPDDAAHGAGLRLGPRAGRHRRQPGLHPDLAGPLRLVEVGRPARTAAGDHLLPQVVPAQHLRLRLLGAADDRAADRRLREAPRAARALRPRRAAHRPARPEPAAARSPPWRAGTASSSGSTRRCTSTARSRRAGCAGPRCAAPPAGSSSARRTTAAGAASSRPPSTPSSRCTCSATTWTTRCCRPASPPSTGSPSGARTAPG